MSAQEQISRLQGLLERIKRNAAGPRTGATRTTASAPLAAPPPFAVPAPAPYAAPAPVPHAPPAPAYAAPAPAPVDASVDELLAGSPELSPPPVEVDVPLDTIPPAAEAEADAPDADPIPLVSAPNAYNVPPLEDPFNLESEVSEVRVTTGEREFGTEVTVAAIEAEAEPIAPEELSEDDLVEVLDVTAMPPPVTSDIDIDFEDEQPPASSQRSRVASSMDEALAAAAAQLDAEREVPLKTPPPESGPQESPMPSAFSAPAAPDVDSLLDQELDIPTHAHAPAGQAGPTTEQLGQTIDLEEARGPSLELAEPQSAPPPSGRLEELEVALPPRDANGGYDDDLQPPPEARDDLEAHRRSLADAASSPEVVTRAVPVGSPETFASARDSFKPSSFLELLDASLSLYGE
ncbi:MAG TPA: hypothetical protein VIW29_06025 [Polyangiaceae bacterium]